MPYHIKKEGDKWCVYNKDTGKNKGCSTSEKMAKKHMAAMYAAENKSLVEFSMRIVKATTPKEEKADRTMRISMINSDTGEDAYEERMSLELFNDFVNRIEANLPVPSPFNEVVNEGGWEGGMPYLSISHYKSGNGVNVPGKVEKVYADGERLKSHAILSENPLGIAVWKSICTDIEERSKPLEEKTYENPVRISIGFLDLEHKHEIEGEDDYIFTRTELKQKCEKCEEGINGKVYLKGQLVHLAFTRVPANPRTQVEVLRMSDEIETKKQDAESIIGDLAEELIGKSVIEDEALVVKTEHDMEDDEEEGRDRKKKKEEDKPSPEKSEVTMEEDTQVVEEPVQEEVVDEEPVAEVAPAKSTVEDTVNVLLEKFNAVKEHKAGKNELQPILNQLVNTLNEETADPTEKMLMQMEERMSALFDEKLGQMKVEITQEVLKSIPSGQPIQQKQEIPTARSLIVNRNNLPEKGEQELTQIQKMALASTR